jgi:hypothetical protein
MVMENNKIYEWIVNIINSCRDDFHFEAVDNLIELFLEREKDEDLYLQLKGLRKNKWNEIHYILE